MPNTRIPSINSAVAIGRRMNGSEMLIGNYLRGSVAAQSGNTSRELQRRSAGGARWPRLDQPDMSAFGQAKLTVDDYPLAGLEAFGDNRNPVLDRGHLDRASLDR